MDAQDDAELKELVRTVRTRVPLDAADLLAQESPQQIEAVLRALPLDLALRITAALPETLRPALGSAAAAPAPGQVSELLEPARGVLRSGTTVQQAFDFLREAEMLNDITYLYVVDAQDKLLGLVVIRDLLVAQLSQTLDEIMIRRPFTLQPQMPIGDAIRAAVRRHYPVYPVIDADGKLLGVVRGWRLAEQQAIEISAQSGNMVGVQKEERVSTSVWSAFRLRHPWLQVNLVTAFAAGFVVSLFEGTITQIVALAAFLPILAGQSGNNGCQALAITLRGITLGDMDGYPVRRLVRKEILLGALNGMFTGAVAGLAMWWFAGGASNPQSLLLGLVILLAMTGSCMASGFFGVMVPLVLKRFGADPSTASSIFLTTGTDIAGMGLMLLLATTIVL